MRFEYVIEAVILLQVFEVKIYVLIVCNSVMTIACLISTDFMALYKCWEGLRYHTATLDKMSSCMLVCSMLAYNDEEPWPQNLGAVAMQIKLSL